jgi:hypothetical protein
MITKIYQWILKGLAGSLLFLCHFVSAQTPLPPVSVSVSQSTVAGGVRYQYQVSNHSNFPITSVIIGLNYFDGKPELGTTPSGWTADAGIPASSVNSPSGWNATVIPTEDTSLVELSWSASGSAALAPGKTLQGFSVIVPSADATYSGSHWTVYVNGAGKNYFSGILSVQTLPCDTPRISISLSPNILWPPNHKLVKITANVSVQDDNYPNPAVKLVSVTANETLHPGDIVAAVGTDATTFQVKSERTGKNKAGRIYTVTYSATNACGNSASSSQIVTVPHDRGH